MLLSLNNITFEFGARTILENASWHIYANERIGLIGPNGTGKSTLLKILIGEYAVSSGQVNRSKTLTIGYFHQDLQSMDTDDDILHVAMGAFDKALAIDKEIKELEVELHDGSDEKDLNRLAELYHDFDLAGGYEMEYKSAEVLEGLGFKTVDLQRSFKEFSGGWRMRVLLAKMILQNPDILLLDEPTNHLDLPSIEWIEKYLQGYPGSVIIVSHDRYFLDKMVTKIVEISQQTLNHYTGDYSYFEKEKEIRNDFQLREYENQQEFISQQERFIDRFKAKASKAKQAQSLVKKLDRLEKIEAPINETSKINFSFQVGIQPGKIMTTLTNVSKSYGDLHILRNAEAEIVRGDKIALIGANGKGKSTLLRLISQTETVDGGTITPGHNIEISFYAQHQLEALQMNDDIMEELKMSGSGKTEQELRELMGCFLFRGDDVFKKIRVLSGGEKARVALAKTIISRSNYLLLDEPTNHLDISSVKMLIQALNKFEGTYVLVSHDRYFIQNTANKIWEIEDGKISIFDGNYNEWEDFKKRKALAEKSKQGSKEPIIPEVVKPEKVVEAPKPSVSLQKEKNREEKKLRNQFNKLESDLSKMNFEKNKLEGMLADSEIYSNKEKFQKAESEYQILSKQLAAVQAEYEKIFEQLMDFEA
ncbi:MAG: ABC-F family ATP-binding cassette domain-containing protein [Bacteroidetes bacterium]|nr:ABC-F family ATP-binding cassette domain-containing protein [Bacteroidota bacterium]MBP6315934.1 ABC-F family ATP-binding cassette domain-containing protein [Chitinophagaceae bacterium]